MSSDGTTARRADDQRRSVDDVSVPSRRQEHNRQLDTEVRYQRRVKMIAEAEESVATLVHAFVTSRIDYCNGLLAGAQKAVTDKLKRVMNSAARVSNTRKFDHGLTHVRHDILHWLDVPERVTFKLCMTVYKCLHGMGPIYCVSRPSSSEAGRRHLRSATVWSTRRSPLQANDCWQQGILLRQTVCVEQSSRIYDSRHAYLRLF